MISRRDILGIVLAEHPGAAPHEVRGFLMDELRRRGCTVDRARRVVADALMSQWRQPEPAGGMTLAPPSTWPPPYRGGRPRTVKDRTEQ